MAEMTDRGTLINMSGEMQLKGAMTIPEAATYMSIGENSLRDLIKAGKLPFILVNAKRWLVTRAACDKYLANLQTTYMPPVSLNVRRGPKTMPRLAGNSSRYSSNRKSLKGIKGD